MRAEPKTERDFALAEIDRHLHETRHARFWDDVTPDNQREHASAVVIHIREMRRHLSTLEREARNTIYFSHRC